VWLYVFSVALCETNNNELTQRTQSFHRVSQRTLETGARIFLKELSD
jgi:hypothetical protein